MNVLQWIDAISTESKYEETVRERVPGTCGWILESTQFQRWMSANIPSSSILWIHGIPGSGKTYLSARIIEYLQSLPNGQTAYFFCANEELEKREPISILRSWIQQIGSQRLEAFQVIEKVYKNGKELSRLHSPTDEKLWEMFRLMLQRIPPRVYLVVDGFDECVDYNQNNQYRTQGRRRRFLDEIVKTCRLTTARFLIVSRYMVDIEQRVVGVGKGTVDVNEYQISKRDTDADLSLLARHLVIEALPEKSAELRNEFIQDLSDRTDGMFLLLRLQCERLRGSAECTDSQLREILSGTTGLDEDGCYQRELENISRHPLESRKRAGLILRWVQFAARPLTVSELAEALVLRPGDSAKEFNSRRTHCIPNPIEERFVRNQILSLCGSLVTFRLNEGCEVAMGTVHLVHFTLKEFLDRIIYRSEVPHQLDSVIAKIFFSPRDSEIPHPYDFAWSHSFLAECCLTYLKFERFNVRRNTDCAVVLKEYHFYQYAAVHWNTHFAASGNVDHRFVQNVTEFIDIMDARLNYEFWLCQYGKLLGSNSYLEPLPKPTWHSLTYNYAFWWRYVMMVYGIQRKSYFGSIILRDVVEQRLPNLIPLVLDSTGVSVNFTLPNHETYLHLATRNRDYNTVDILLKLGANVHKRGEYGTPLQAAARTGGNSEIREEGSTSTTTIMQLLLDRGACPTSNSWINETPIQIAASNGHQKELELLLAHGCDINYSNIFYLTAIQGAALRGQVSMTKFLLESGADANRTSWLSPTALHLVPEKITESLWQIFLEKMPNFISKGRSFATLLKVVDANGHEDVYRLLLRNALASTRYNSAPWIDEERLQIATRLGDEKLVRYMLGKGFNVNSQGKWFGSALHVAAYYNLIAIATLLLDRHADINAENDAELAVVEYDVELGFPALFKSRWWRGGTTALQAAASQGHIEMVRLLVERGANKNCNKNCCGTAVYHAAIAGSLPIVKLLVDRDTGLCDVNIIGGRYGTPLQAASRNGDTAMVRLLLGNGAEINTVSGELGTALQAAIILYPGFGQFKDRTDYQMMFQNFIYENLLRTHFRSISFLLYQTLVCSVYGYSVSVYVERGNNELVQLLLSKGADLWIQGGRYHTALQAAAHISTTEVFKTIRDAAHPWDQIHTRPLTGGEFGNPLIAAISARRFDNAYFLMKWAGLQPHLLPSLGPALLRLFATKLPYVVAAQCLWAWFVHVGSGRVFLWIFQAISNLPKYVAEYIVRCDKQLGEAIAYWCFITWYCFRVVIGRMLVAATILFKLNWDENRSHLTGGSYTSVLYLVPAVWGVVDILGYENLLVFTAVKVYVFWRLLRNVGAVLAVLQ